MTVPMIERRIFFFQAEDGIRDADVTGSSDVCSSDLLPRISSGACADSGSRIISGGGLGFLQQRSNALGGLCTLTQPVAYALLVDGQASFTTGSDRVEETNALNETAIASVAAVSNSQVVEGALLGAATSKTNGYHVNIVSCI